MNRVVSDLGLRVQEPRIHTFEGAWAFRAPPGEATLHLVRHGDCSAWKEGARHSQQLGTGDALLLSGAAECALQGRGPRRSAGSPLDWNAGASLEQTVFRPTQPAAVQLLSARLESRSRRALARALSPIVVLRPERIYLSGFREPVLETLSWELSCPRPGATFIVLRLLEIYVVQGLRTELTAGFSSAPGWLGALTDPVLRTGLAGSRPGALPQSVSDLAAAAHRSDRRIRARVKAHSGDTAGRLVRRFRIERALQQMELGTPNLAELARQVGYADVSSFCRAFRREVGCTPATYWRRVNQRPLPRVGTAATLNRSRRRAR